MMQGMDPRLKLMQKWSSNLPEYDSTYLREDGDDDYDDGADGGVDSQFLGARTSVKSVARKIDKLLPKKSKGKSNIEKLS